MGYKVDELIKKNGVEKVYQIMTEDLDADREVGKMWRWELFKAVVTKSVLEQNQNRVSVNFGATSKDSFFRFGFQSPKTENIDIEVVFSGRPRSATGEYDNAYLFLPMSEDVLESVKEGTPIDIHYCGYFEKQRSKQYHYLSRGSDDRLHDNTVFTPTEICVGDQMWRGVLRVFNVYVVEHQNINFYYSSRKEEEQGILKRLRQEEHNS